MYFLDEVKEWVCEDNQAVALSFDCDFGCDDGTCAPPPWIQEQKLVASDAYGGQMLGSSAAIDGNVAILGAVGDDDLGDESGSAYIYRFDGNEWIEEQKLLASDGAEDDQFGYSVSISGNVAVVSAPFDDDLASDSGSAYIYRFNGTDWVEEQKLVVSDGVAADRFGRSVSVFDDVIMVGASGVSGANGRNYGAVYVFRLDGSVWIQQQKLLTSDGAKSDSFGWSVSVSNNTVLVGAKGNDDHGLSSGSAYVFSFNGVDWSGEQKLTASDAEQWEQFGWSVDVASDVAVIGANQDNDSGLNSGSAYVFRFNGVNWIEEKKLLASDGAEGDKFASIVSIDGNTAVVGAQFHDWEGSTDLGAAYVYRFNGIDDWIEERKFKGDDSYRLDEFGSAVAVSENKTLVGALGEDHHYMSTGSAYIFRSTEDEVRRI